MVKSSVSRVAIVVVVNIVDVDPNIDNQSEVDDNDDGLIDNDGGQY